MQKKELKEQLEIWNEQIINFGSDIISARLNFVAEIEPIAREFLDNISKHTENLALIYKSTVFPEVQRSGGPEILTSRPHSKNLYKKLLTKSLHVVNQ